MFGEDRRETIALTISDELDRQARAGANRIDVDAMAAAIDGVLEGEGRRMPGRAQMRAAKRPDQLNATNDG
jgi:hypothetical protein